MVLRSARHGAARLLVGVAVAALAAGLLASVAVSAPPEGRGYELVSPPDKNGGDIVADSHRTRAAGDGSAVGFISLTAFGDAIGTGVGTDYIAQRSARANPGSNGWTSHAITPLQAGIPIRGVLAGYEPVYEGEFSENLDSGVFFSWTPLTDDPGVENVGNFYRRTDLRTPGAGSYELVTACPLCETTRSPLPPVPSAAVFAVLLRQQLAGMSPDAGHVLFESRYPLTSDTPAQPGTCNLFTTPTASCRVHLFEWDHGTLRLAGILPDGTAADVSIAGAGVGASHTPTRTPHVVSNGADGHTRVFFTQPTNARGQTSSQLVGSAQNQANRASSGNVFMRIDGATTEQLNLSERGTSDTFQPAQFLDASVDGTRSFLMTRQALTDDAPVSTAVKLYMYDASKPADAPDNLTLLNPDSGEGSNAQGMIGASDDGRYVYMLVSGQLVRGEPSIGNNVGIFLWHDGTIEFVGPASGGPALAELLSTLPNYLIAPRQARVAPDGRHVLFSAINGDGLTGYDHGRCESEFGTGCRELYVYSADSGQLQCASCNPSGAPATTMASVLIRTNTSGTRATWHETRALSDDGRYVFFNTSEALVPDDTNGRSDAYVYDTQSGAPQLLSSGQGTGESYFLDAGRDGRDVFILTRERLVGWDTDTAYDLYDVRVGGGFPEPVRAPAACSGAACQGLPGLAPAAGSVGTALFGGGGDLAEPIKRAKACRRGFVKKRVRGKRKCVKRHRTHRAKRANVMQRRGS